jgi:hypothetical protein
MKNLIDGLHATTAIEGLFTELTGSATVGQLAPGVLSVGLWGAGRWFVIGSQSSLRFYISPNSELLRVVSGNSSLLAEILQQTWECDIARNGRSVWSIDDYRTQAKLAVLARIYEDSVSDPSLFDCLTTNVPYQLDQLFDKWWNIHHVTADEYITGQLSECELSTLRRLPTTDRPNVVL